ncbi:MAG TPA: hypothetical protein VG167_15900, partial [Verrucomicrobiae bacterium]|nr:hypothetical protein [Verrucomicrobiae bacterium]
ENRLIKMAARTGVGPQISLQFDYDSQSRRIRKQVWSNASCSGPPTNDVRFTYDAWNLVAEVDGLNACALLRSYTWGLDTSGTLQGAGGVGGLLELSYPSEGLRLGSGVRC